MSEEFDVFGNLRAVSSGKEIRPSVSTDVEAKKVLSLGDSSI